METEAVLRLRSQIWFGALLTALGLILFVMALLTLAVQFQHNLGIEWFTVPKSADNPLLVAAPLLTISGIACTLIGLNALAVVRNIRRVRSHGFLGKARVVSTTPTEVQVEGRKLVQVDMIVELNGVEPYSASTRAALERASAGIEAGSEMQVRVDPKDEQRILFV